MPPKDGTYIVRNGELHEHVMAFGYYVATEEIDTSNTAFVEENSLIGIWTDKETGKVYIDKTRWVHHLADALDDAVYFHQLAIWDCADNAEIRL